LNENLEQKIEFFKQKSLSGNTDGLLEELSQREVELKKKHA
jgi:hypothetical protein